MTVRSGAAALSACIARSTGSGAPPEFFPGSPASPIRSTVISISPGANDVATTGSGAAGRNLPPALEHADPIEANSIAANSRGQENRFAPSIATWTEDEEILNARYSTATDRAGGG